MGREHLRSVSTVTNDPTQASGGYSPDKYWTRSSDSQGHSFDARATLPKFWRGQIAELVDNRRFPYKSNAQFIRDAVWHRLQWCRDQLKEDVPEMTTRWGLENMEASLDAFMVDHEAYERWKDQLERVLAIVRVNGDQVAFNKLLDKLARDSDQLREPMASQAREKISHVRMIVR